ncbi:MAG: hypothetical protein ABJE66_20985 [Deltaproteobacteria bacterium]
MSKLVILAVTAAASLCIANVAHADPSDTGAQGPKDPGTALELSLGGTVASGALFAIGIEANNGGLVAAGLLSSLVTPSLGEWYAGKPLTIGMGVRAASAVVLLAGLDESLKCLGETSCTNDTAAAGALLLGGLVGYAGGTIYDIATAPNAARDFNREHQIHLAPTYLRTPSGNATMGIGIGGTF